MITLPATPSPNEATGRRISFGGVMRPGLGAKLLVLNRQGDRFAIDVTYPPMPAEEMGALFVSRLIRAKREGIRIPMPLLGVDQGAPGSPIVDGAGQAGLSLNIRNVTPGYEALEGYWLSIVSPAGQHYLHNVSEDTTANLSGKMTLSIEPMLRVRFADACAVHLVAPMIEGLVVGDEAEWRLSVDHMTGLSFTIEEAE